METEQNAHVGRCGSNETECCAFALRIIMHTQARPTGRSEITWARRERNAVAGRLRIELVFCVFFSSCLSNWMWFLCGLNARQIQSEHILPNSSEQTDEYVTGLTIGSINRPPTDTKELVCVVTLHLAVENIKTESASSKLHPIQKSYTKSDWAIAIFYCATSCAVRQSLSLFLFEGRRRHFVSLCLACDERWRANTENVKIGLSYYYDYSSTLHSTKLYEFIRISTSTPIIIFNVVQFVASTCSYLRLLIFSGKGKNRFALIVSASHPNFTA